MANPYLFLLKISWKYARKERGQYLLIYALFLLCSVGYAMNPLVFGWIIDSIQRDPAKLLSSGWIYIGCFFALQILIGAIHSPARVKERQLAFTISQNFLDELFHQLLHLPVSWHQDHHSGSTINRLKKAYGSLKSFFQNGFSYFYAFAQFIFAFVAMLYFSPLFGMIALVLGFFTIWVILRFDKPFIKSLEDSNEKEHLMSATLTDSITNIFTVITLRLEKRMKKDLEHKFNAMLPPFRRNAVINEWKWFTAGLLISVIYAVMVAGYVYSNYKPGETFYLGGLAALLGYVDQFTNAFTRIAQAYTDIVGFSTDVRTIKNIEETFQKNHRPVTQNPLPDNWQRIAIRQLNFNYTKHPWVNGMPLADIQPHTSILRKENHGSGLHAIGIDLKRGQRIALIGESGSGKSTLLALLRGLYTPLPGGELVVDGKSTFEWSSIADTVTLFPQEPEIFENTIAYNITLGLPFSEQDIVEVCEIACLTGVINQLPHGLESTIQEKGVNLSVGQKQRLALARGILASRNSSIVLLDEPTSSVDSQTEMLIYKGMFEAFADKVVISSLHNLNLITHFDYGYVLHEGHLVEQGTPAELYNGNYLTLTNVAISPSVVRYTE